MHVIMILGTKSREESVRDDTGERQNFSNKQIRTMCCQPKNPEEGIFNSSIGQRPSRILHSYLSRLRFAYELARGRLVITSLLSLCEIVFIYEKI